MVGNNHLTTIQVVVALASATLAAAVALMIYSSYASTSAEIPIIVDDGPMADTSQLLKIRDVKILKSASANPNIELQASTDGLSISFLAKNNGKDPVHINVDSWNATVSGEILAASESVQMQPDSELRESSSSIISRMDLSNYSNVFEVYPGAYTIEVVGWKWYEKDFGSFKKLGNWPDYLLTANVTIDYDIDEIKASENKLLKLNGMQIGIQGEGNLYDVGKSSPKKIIYYLFNDGQSDMSGLVASSDFALWNSESRFPGVGTSIESEPNFSKCTALKPGDEKMVEVRDLSFTESPLGGPYGLSKQLGSDTSVSGIYIAHYQVTTVSCTTPEGEQLKGGLHSAIIAFEVLS